MATLGNKQFLRRSDVCEVTGLSYSTIFRLERDSRFPQRRQLSDNAVGWLRAEVEEWVAKRMVVNAKT